uniref:Putative ovule protein n=1 Tax=Solanum chacoense TaxID=4108 RepID=A0A0V0GXB6_SOLCH
MSRFHFASFSVKVLVGIKESIQHFKMCTHSPLPFALQNVQLSCIFCRQTLRYPKTSTVTEDEYHTAAFTNKKASLRSWTPEEL